MGAALAEASNNPTRGSRRANCTRSPADSNPSGAPSRKISGWIVPKTERRGPGNAVSAGRACVPADLRTNPRIITAIPNGIARSPNRTNTPPNNPYPRRLWRKVQRQRTSPDAGESKHADCGKNRSDRLDVMAKGGGAEIGPTKRGKGMKIMAIVDRHGLPLSVSTHAANHHEVRLVQLCFDFYMIEAKPENLIGDRSHDSDPLDEELRKDGIEMIAPHRSNRSKPPTQDRRRLSRYMRRWLVERSSPGFNGSAASSFAGSTTPTISSALSQLACPRHPLQTILR